VCSALQKKVDAALNWVLKCPCVHDHVLLKTNSPAAAPAKYFADTIAVDYAMQQLRAGLLVVAPCIGRSNFKVGTVQAVQGGNPYCADQSQS
jgi:hypothetical protein